MSRPVKDRSLQVGGRTVSSYAVNYPASYDFLTTADGATDATGHISQMAQSCPSTKIVLGGSGSGKPGRSLGSHEK